MSKFRPFKDITEFKSVTGLKLGDIIQLHSVTSKNFTYDFTGIFSGYAHCVDDTHEENEWVIYIGANMFSLNSLVSYSYLTKDGWQCFGVEYETANDDTV